MLRDVELVDCFPCAPRHDRALCGSDVATKVRLYSADDNLF